MQLLVSLVEILIMTRINCIQIIYNQITQLPAHREAHPHRICHQSSSLGP